MKKIIAVALLGIVVFSCKNSKTNLSGDQPVNAANLIKAFPELKLPLNIADTSLDNFGDTSVISY